MTICRPCPILVCDIPADLDVGGGTFATVGYSFIISCPPGYYCFTGDQLVIIPPGIIPPVRVPPPFGGVISLIISGCLSPIARVLPANATQAQINAAIASMQAEWAAQQAQCNVINPPPPGTPGAPMPPGPPPVPLPPPVIPPGGSPPSTRFPRVDVCNIAQSFTASCTPPTIGLDVTVTVPAKTYCLTLLNATLAQVAFAQYQTNTLALQEATVLANAALSCSSLCPSIIDAIANVDLLEGYCCYAPSPNLGIRPHFVFFSDTSGVRWIDNITVQAGLVPSPLGDTALGMTYATVVNRVFVSIDSVPCYLMVINPDNGTIDTTFGNGVSQDFQYMRYAPVKDRIYCLQSNNPVINLIVINPNTNAITNTVPYGDVPVDANFNAGVDYCPVNDKIYIGRQGFTNPLDQLVRVFDGTALTPVVDINIATLQPYDLIYCSDFNVVCVGCQEYSTFDNAVLIIDCATNTVIGNVTIPTGQVPNTLGYNSQTKKLFADTGVFIYVIDIPTAAITCTVPVISQPNSYAFNTSNSKMYRPRVGALIIDTLQ